MLKDTIKEAQEYLTVLKNNRRFKILDLEALLSRHSIFKVIEILTSFADNKLDALKKALSQDKTAPENNEMIAMCFRTQMALNIIRNKVQSSEEYSSRPGLNRSA